MGDIDELRRLLAEATPKPWHASLLSPPNVFGGPVGKLVAEAQMRSDAVLVSALRNAAPELLGRLEKAEQDRVWLRGAMDAQDERERVAGERCGVSANVVGCDWPERVADEVLALRDRLQAVEADLARKG